MANSEIQGLRNHVRCGLGLIVVLVAQLATIPLATSWSQASSTKSSAPGSATRNGKNNNITDIVNWIVENSTVRYTSKVDNSPFGLLSVEERSSVAKTPDICTVTLKQEHRYNRLSGDDGWEQDETTVDLATLNHREGDFTRFTRPDQ